MCRCQLHVNNRQRTATIKDIRHKGNEGKTAGTHIPTSSTQQKQGKHWAATRAFTGSKTGSWVQSVVVSAQKPLELSLEMVTSKYRQPFVLPGAECCSGAGRACEMLISGFQIAVEAFWWSQIVVYSAQKPPGIFHYHNIKLSTKVCVPYRQANSCEADSRCQVMYSNHLVCG